LERESEGEWLAVAGVFRREEKRERRDGGGGGGEKRVRSNFSKKAFRVSFFLSLEASSRLSTCTHARRD
jgi:hypothetical protein